MIQPLAKLWFVERYCKPSTGWAVFVDVDPSEEGRTGSTRLSNEAKARQALMRSEAPLVVQGLKSLKAYVGERKAAFLGGRGGG